MTLPTCQFIVSGPFIEYCHPYIIKPLCLKSCEVNALNCKTSVVIHTTHDCMARVNLPNDCRTPSLSLPYAYIATGQAPHNVGSNDDVVGGGVSCHLHVVPGVQVPAASLPPPTVSLLWGDLHSGLGLCLHWGHHHSVRPRD